MPRPEVEPHRQRHRQPARREGRHHSLRSPPATFIMNALAPAKVIGVELFEDDGVALVVVPDYQLSLAIGRDGQNVRLAARLTGWRLDIASESEVGASARALSRRTRGARPPRRPTAAPERSPRADAGRGYRRGADSKARGVSPRAFGEGRRRKPVRSCVGCRRRFPQDELTRFVRTAAGWRADRPAVAAQASGPRRLPLLARMRASARAKTNVTRGLARRRPNMV